mmetsp:Transcript_40078/g.78513  ORF Transcript_40078/g.78513 Transcript_40078/m.78513 type:complete len:200 (+) Transcript_40078:87-686(+)
MPGAYQGRLAAEKPPLPNQKKTKKPAVRPLSRTPFGVTPQGPGVQAPQGTASTPQGCGPEQLVAARNVGSPDLVPCASAPSPAEQLAQQFSETLDSIRISLGGSPSATNRRESSIWPGRFSIGSSSPKKVAKLIDIIVPWMYQSGSPWVRSLARVLKWLAILVFLRMLWRAARLLGRGARRFGYFLLRSSPRLLKAGNP